MVNKNFSSERTHYKLRFKYLHHPNMTNIEGDSVILLFEVFGKNTFHF